MPALVQNYRPISLLSLAGKLQERLVHSKLLGRGAISPSQFGFQPGSSTQEALYQLPRPGTNIWKMGLAQFVCFWTWQRPLIRYLSHQDVIDALAGSGVCGSLLVWFCDCLTERSQRVVLQGSSSHSITVPSGIPQGSILGPLLFFLTFNGIFQPSLI